MASVEQTPEKVSKRDLFESIISPSQNSEKKRKNTRDSDRDSTKERTLSEKKTFDIFEESSESTAQVPVTDANVKCLEVVFPNNDRCGVHVSLLKTTGELLTECMKEVKDPKEGVFCLMSEEDMKVDTEMLSKELDFDATYYIKAA
jgi:hypothetical protein